MGASGLTPRVLLLALVIALGATGCIVEAGDSDEQVVIGDVESDDQALGGDETQSTVRTKSGGGAFDGTGKHFVLAAESGGPTPEPWRGECDGEEESGPTPEPWDQTSGPTPEPWRETDDDDTTPHPPAMGTGSGSPSHTDD